MAATLLVALGLLAWALLLFQLDDHSFWYDEGYAVYTANLSPADTLLWSSRDFVPPLHVYLLSLWLPVSGWTEFSARFLSTSMGMLMLAGMVRLGKDLHSWPAGLLAGLLAATAPFYVWYGREARMYACQAAFGLMATLFLVRALRRPRRWGPWIGLGLADGLALYSQATGGFLIPFHALVILVSGLGPGKRFRLIRGGLALSGAAVAWSPWLVYAWPFFGQNAGYWAGELEWWFVVSGAFRGFVTGEMMGKPAELVAVIAWGGGCLVGLTASAVSPHSRWSWRTALFLLAYFAVPVAAMAWLFRAVPKFSPRYLILASPPIFLLPAIGVATLSRQRSLGRVLGGSIVTALLVLAGRGLNHLYTDPAFAKSDFRSAARLVEAQRTAGETVLLVPGHVFPVWQFYYGTEGWVALPDDPILDVRHVLHYRDTVKPLNEGLREYSGVWLVEWEPWVVDPTGLVPFLLARQGQEVESVALPGGVQVSHYRLDGSWDELPSEPQVVPTSSSNLGLPLALVGCALPDPPPADRAAGAGCYWEAQGPLPLHLSVSARLVDGAGNEWGRADAAITGPYLVAGRWPGEKPVLGKYAVVPVPGAPPGDFYRLALHVYAPGGTTYGVAEVDGVALARPTRPFTGTPSFAQEPPIQVGGLILEGAQVTPPQVLPGDEIRVEAVWRVAGPFAEPHLELVGQESTALLLPQPGATDVWQEGDRYRTISQVGVSPYAPGGKAEMRAVSTDGGFPLGTAVVDVERRFTLPADAQRVNYQLGKSISLKGADISVTTGDTVEVVLYWQAEALVARSYTVFVHLVGPDGQIYAQADSIPRDGRHPTAHWVAGEVVADEYTLEYPAGAPPGEYRVLVGMYAFPSLDRLPVTADDGSPVADDAIPLDTIPVD